MNGYICFYKGKRLEVHADTLLAARDKAAAHFKARHAYAVICVLTEVDGEQVTYRTVSL